MQYPHEELEVKGNEIIDMVQKIGELIPEDSDILLATKGQMFADACNFGGKSKRCRSRKLV